MSKMFDNAFKTENNAPNIENNAETPVKPAYETGGGYEKNTVKAPKTAPNTTRIDSKVVNEEGTKSFLNILEKPRQNNRAEAAAKAEALEDQIQNEPPPVANQDQEPFNPDFEDREVNDNDFNFDDQESPFNDDPLYDAEAEDSDDDGTIPDIIIEGTVDFGFNQVNIYLPKFIAFLNEVENSDDYRITDPREIENIKHYAVIVAKKHNVGKLSDESQLALAVGMAYGIPLMKGLIKQSPKILQNISRVFKRAAGKNAPPPPPPKPKQEVLVNCMDPHCPEMFKQGEGFPKNSKFPHLVGKFCKSKHFTKYTNTHGLTGNHKKK